MSQLERRVLGRSGLEVSALGIGCWAIGGKDWNLSLPMGWSGANDRDALEGLVRAFEIGATLFDTADIYGHGRSERLVGEFLRHVPRHEVVISSKVGYFQGTAPSAYHPLHLRHQLEMTLANLGTDHLDIYAFHNFHFGPDDRFLEGAVGQMLEFREQGLVRAIGMRGPHRFAPDRVSVPTDGPADKYARFMIVADILRPDIVSVRYNMLTPDAADGAPDIFSWAEQHSVGLLINKPLAQGLLTDKYDPHHPPVFGPGDHRQRKRWFTAEGLRPLHSRLVPLRKRFGDAPADMVRIALQYCLQRSPQAAVVVGFKNATQVEMNLTSLHEPLSGDELAYIRSAIDGLNELMGPVFREGADG